MSEDKKFQQNKPRMTQAIVPADKVSKVVFNLNEAQFSRAMEDGFDCEDGKKVNIPVWLENAEGFLDKTPLTPFDREVVFSLISAYEAGYRTATYHSILSAMTGSDKCRIYDNQYEAIKKAVYKGQGTIIQIDVSPLSAYSKYNNKKCDIKIRDNILPCRVIEATYNGQKTLVIEMRGESPLMTYAKFRKQFQKYDLKPLAVPNQRNTPLVIVIKHELRRWVDAVITRELNNTLTLTVFLKNIGHADADKFKKRKIRETMAATLNHFVAEKIITSWYWTKSGNAYEKITISYDKA